MLRHCQALIYCILGPDNDATYSLRSIILIHCGVTESNIIRKILNESYFVDKLDCNMFPLTYYMIDKYICKDKEQVDKLKRAKYHTEYICSGRNIMQLFCGSEKIVAPR